MKRILFLLLFTLILSSCGLFIENSGLKSYSPKEKITAKGLNDYQYDFIYLSEIIDEGFPLIDNIFPEVERKSLKQESIAKLEYAKDNIDFLLQTRKYLSNLKNEHTNISLNHEFKSAYPFVIYNSYDNWYLLNLPKKFDSLFIGKKILKVNGILASEVEKRLIDFTFSENKISQQKEVISLQLYNKPQFLKETNIIQNLEGNLTLTFEDNSLLILSPILADEKNEGYEISVIPNSITGYKNKTYFYKIYPKQNLGYLQFNRAHDKIDILDGIDTYVKPWMRPFARSYANRQFRKKQPSKRFAPYFNKEYPVFKDFAWEFIDSLNRNNIQNLIIDLRNNPGGNLTLGIQLMYFLTSEDSLRGFSEYAYTSHVFKQYFDGQYKVLELKYPGGVPDNNLILKEDNENLFIKITDIASNYFIPKSRPVFKGDIYILSNYNTGSAAAMLATLFQDNNIGTIVGTTVGNNPIGATTYTPMKLPKTKAKISVATNYIVRPLESNGKILIPDFWVEYSIEDLLSGRDPYMDKVKQLIMEKSGY